MPIHDEKDNIVGLLGITREINELKQVEQDLQYLATHDSLTTLPNRFLLFDAIEQAIKRAARNKKHLAILYLDLDGFKGVNDQFGHDEGDRLLKQVALRIAKAIRETDRAARLGGDEFAVLLEDLDGSPEAMLVAEKIRAAVAEPYDHLPRNTAITASIGVSMFPGRAKTASALVSAADHAMYQAKVTKNAAVLFVSPTS